MSDDPSYDIGISPRFPGREDVWIVHGCNANRHPKIAYMATKALAELTANAVREVIAQAVEKATADLRAQLEISRAAHEITGNQRDAALHERDEARGKAREYYWRLDNWSHGRYDFDDADLKAHPWLEEEEDGR